MKSVTELIEGLLIQANQEVDEFNHVHDELTEANTVIETLRDHIERLEKAAVIVMGDHEAITEKHNILEQQCDTIYVNGEKHLIAAKQAIREREQMKDKLDTATELLKAYKAIDTPKKIREKYKNYQTKIAAGSVDLSKSKELIKEYRKEIVRHVDQVNLLREGEAQANMSSIWSENGDNLMLFPSKLTMQVGDTTERQLTLLYMTKSGCGKLIALDDEGKPAICKMPAGGMKPKKRTLEVAGELLRKWRRQDWKITLSDLDLANK